MILFCYGVILVVVVATACLIGAVAWHEWVKIHVFAIACSDCEGSGSAAGAGGFEDEECPTCWGSGAEIDPDDDAGDRARAERLDYEAGVW